MNNAQNLPRVTVFIPAFNAERFIGEAIQSILDQTFEDFELLLIDDGSQDATIDIMTSYADDPRLRIVCNLENRGQPWTRNEGLRIAQGAYIALLDADDIAAPERLQKQSHYLDNHPDITVLGSRHRKIDNHGILKSISPKPIGLQHDELLSESLFDCPIQHPTVMARTQPLRNNGYSAFFARAQDHDLWSRMFGQHRFLVLPDCLTFYRRHQEQLTQSFRSDSLNSRRVIQKRELQNLGISFSERDLLRHAILNSGRKKFHAVMGYELDQEYLTWARRWLDTLITANEQRCIYPEPAFSRMASIYWASLCRKAVKPAGIRTVSLEFCRSRLKWQLPAGLIRMWWDRRPSWLHWAISR